MKRRHCDAYGVMTTIDDRTLAEAQADAVARIRTEYEAQIARGMTYAGKPLQIDEASCARMTSIAAMTSKAFPLPADFAWRMGDNTYLPMDAAAQALMAVSAAGRVQALRKLMWAAIDVARATRSNEEADLVAVEWPPA